MIQKYVKKLMEDLPETITNKKKPKYIDLILDGGAFNGSYLVGALYFLKEMEEKKYIKIRRISGASVGSIVAFLYLIDSLESMSELYDIAKQHFTKNHNLEFIKQFKKLIHDKLPSDILNRVNNRLFISYNNVKTGKKKVKSVYKNVDEIFISIIKSSYVPYLLDGNIAYNDKYIDGCTPYIFNNENNKETKILYLDLFGYDKIYYVLNITNEKTNFHRILTGLLDIHTFFIKQKNTSMCSYVDEWTLSNAAFYYIKYFFEKICVLIIQIILYVKKIKIIHKDTVLYKLTTKIVKELIKIFVECCCV
jgi:hypothetical protein